MASSSSEPSQTSSPPPPPPTLVHHQLIKGASGHDKVILRETCGFSAEGDDGDGPGHGDGDGPGEDDGDGDDHGHDHDNVNESDDFSDLVVEMDGDGDDGKSKDDDDKENEEEEEEGGNDDEEEEEGGDDDVEEKGDNNDENKGDDNDENDETEFDEGLFENKARVIDIINYKNGQLEDRKVVGKINLIGCSSWDELAARIYEAYLDVTTTPEQVDLINPHTCWPNHTVYYCGEIGNPVFDESIPFQTVIDDLWSILLVGNDNDGNEGAEFDEGLFENKTRVIDIIMYNDSQLEDGKVVRKINLKGCSSWEELAARIYGVYLDVTTTPEPLELINSHTCWPNHTVYYCDKIGKPTLNESKPFQTVVEGLWSIVLVGNKKRKRTNEGEATDGEKVELEAVDEVAFQMYSNLHHLQEKTHSWVNRVPFFNPDENDRKTVVGWMVTFAGNFRLQAETLHLAVGYLDRYISQKNVLSEQYHLVGFTAIFIASKFQQVLSGGARLLDSFLNALSGRYTKQQVITFEIDVMETVNHQLANLTVVKFLSSLLATIKQTGQLRFECLLYYLAELSLLDFNCSKLEPSLVAASVYYLAKFTMNPESHPWNSHLQKITELTPGDLKHCVLAIHKLQTEAYAYQAVINKYNNHDYKCVSLMKPVTIPNFYFEDI